METEESLSRLILELIAQCRNEPISTPQSTGPGEQRAFNKAGFELKPTSQIKLKQKGQM